MDELEQAARANGWTEASADRDIFGVYRSASWRNATEDEILHAVAYGAPERADSISFVEVSTTDPLGWAETRIASWSDAQNNLDDAVAHIQQN
ncbi:Uncharacterised protein (plasmid) [Tsukamurella tyrosinosolvens]|uniref:Uncharacterized protein n=2 Tax=Tsukamurella tyrosinosolvens TaxID=57704 RepID=A0A1H4V2L4_TSUTY|nr:hypothetical protein SAMN04489793_3123 [Tsukamurella tyrosinosolvens]VEH90718.1 Uncharacterised protein [Tsukamurella tyrosinosolvens]